MAGKLLIKKKQLGFGNDMKTLYDCLPIDQLINIREELKLQKNYKEADSIRDYLDSKYVFIFDSKNGQEVYHLTEKFFKFKSKFEETDKMSNRKYVEYYLMQEKRAEKILDAWTFSNTKN